LKTEDVAKITSRDTHMVREASCEIISLGQMRDKITPLIEHLDEIKKETIGLDMGGAFAPNQRFIDFAIKTIEFHKEHSDLCTCALYTAKYKTNAVSPNMEFEYESTNPEKEQEKGNIKILQTTLIDGNWIDYYEVECLKCGQRFKVEERMYHYMWWRWIQQD
jgi:hypothetical protein